MDEAEKFYTVSIHLYAKRKMDAHLDFLARVSIPAAQKLRVAMREAVTSLSHNPLGCVRYKSAVETKLELHCKQCSKRYRIVFHVVDNQVNVIDIQDCRQDTDKNIV